MSTVYDVDPNKLIIKTSELLKKEITMPKWATFIKTGLNKQRPPQQDDWWYIRAAAILREVYVNGPIGTQKLRTKFGGRKDYGTKPSKHAKAYGKIIRTILQQLEEKNYVEKSDRFKKGRVISKKGKSFLDKIATEIKKEENKNGK